MTRTRILTALAAFALAALLAVPQAWAYFTASASAEGSVTLSVEPQTDITEWYGDRTKHVRITNAADASAPVYVRARVFSALPFAAAGAGWQAAGDGWYVYNAIVDPGAATDELTVAVTFPAVASEADPAGAQVGDNYNVIVVYESTPVRYDEAGVPYADWSYVLDRGN